MELSPIIAGILGSVWRTSWQASVLVVLILVAQWLCGRRLAPKWPYALWLLVDLFALQLRRRCPIDEPAVLALFEECRLTMGVRRSPSLLEAPELDGPALFGCFRLKLLLPQKMISAFSPSELRHVFLHELAHIRRWDTAVNWLTTILQTVHWFNPVLWFAFQRMRADRELACDELALARANEAESKPYGQTVIKVLEGFTSPTAIPGLVGILEDKKEIKRRIQMIAQFKKTASWPAMATALWIALGLVSLTDAQTRKGAETLGQRSPEKAKDSNSISQKSTQPGEPLPMASGLTLRKVLDLPKWMEGVYGVSPDGRYLIGAGGTNRIVLDMATGLRRSYNVRLIWPKFSADGTQLVGGLIDPESRTSARGLVTRELLLFDLTTEKTRQLYRRESQGIFSVRDMSQDGKDILVTMSTENPYSFQIVLFSTEDGRMRVLKSFTYNFYPSACALSPDAHWVAYDFPDGGTSKDAAYDTARSIHFLAADGSEAVSRIEHQADHRLLGWSPFGDSVLFTSNRRGTWDAYTVRVVDGKPVGDPMLLKESVGKVQWSSLGFTQSGAFFYRMNSPNSDVYVAALDPVSGKVQGKPVKSTRLEGYSRSPAWSPDGRSLAYLSTRGGDTFGHLDGLLCIRNVETGADREFVEAGRLAFPNWASDGRSVLAVGFENSGQTGAFRVDTDSGKSTFMQRVSVFASTSWGRDGKSVYTKFRTRSPTIARYDLESAAKTEISIPGATPADVAVSPNGDHFAFWGRPSETNSTSRILNVMRAASGEVPRPLLELAGAEAIGVDQGPYYRVLGWTPDSRYVLFAKGEKDKQEIRSLWRVPVAGGEPEPLGLEMEELREPVISPDGRRIAFTAGSAKSEIWVMENFLPKDDVAGK